MYRGLQRLRSNQKSPRTRKYAFWQINLARSLTNAQLLLPGLFVRIPRGSATQKYDVRLTQNALRVCCKLFICDPLLGNALHSMCLFSARGQIPLSCLNLRTCKISAAAAKKNTQRVLVLRDRSALAIWFWATAVRASPAWQNFYQFADGLEGMHTWCRAAHSGWQMFSAAALRD